MELCELCEALGELCGKKKQTHKGHREPTMNAKKFNR
jgi:hypothetical protein